VNKVKLSELDQITQLADLDILEISVYENFEYRSKLISIENFRLTFGIPSHTIQSHTDTDATGSQLDTLIDGGSINLHSHDNSHNVQSHTDTDATGAQLNTLTNGSNADSLHSHDNSHNVQSHTDTDATGAQLNTLTNGSNSDLLHSHDLSHTIASHKNTILLGSQLNTLTDGSNADLLHTHEVGTGIIGWELLIIPTGSINEFVSDFQIPNGWLLCDGSYLSKFTYAALYEKLKDGGSSCIYGETLDDFKLPDLRGLVPRGMSHGSFRDPDAASRTDRGDGTTGDAVGTLQGHSMKSHQHEWKYDTTVDPKIDSSSTVWNHDNRYYINMGYKGGNETRGININVQYCIKY